jgi:hypothetical protein
MFLSGSDGFSNASPIWPIPENARKAVSIHHLLGYIIIDQLEKKMIIANPSINIKCFLRGEAKMAAELQIPKLIHQ